MIKKYNVGIIGATGMVGQRFISLLEDHPWFDIKVLAASSRSAGKTYKEAIANRWSMQKGLTKQIANMKVYDANDVEAVARQVDFVFCAVDMEKDQILKLEEAYAKAEVPLVSNNSANRMTADVPMVIPEINSDHLAVIDQQKKRLGTKRGFIAVKPNCSIQSYVPIVKALEEFKPTHLFVSTYQAISGAGKTFETWPEMIDNVIPYIGGEEEKSEKEPLKVLGKLTDNGIVANDKLKISAQCIRVAASDGHMAATSIKFENKPNKQEIIDRLSNFRSVVDELELPMGPEKFIVYMEEDDRPQTRLDRDADKGMRISVGRLRDDNIFDYKFVGLSHNTIRGAAGGAVLIAELLAKKGYFDN